MDVRDSKSALRAMLREKGRGLSPEYVAASDKAIADNIISSSFFASARSIFIYVSFGFEPDTRRIIDAALRSGKRVYVPFITGPGSMLARRLSDLSDLVPGRFGILTVPSDAETIDAADFDLALVPCVSVSPDGVRLGNGGGYYDRFFAGSRGQCLSLVLCRAQLMCDSIPSEAHDVKFDEIVTEDGLIMDNCKLEMAN